MALSLSLFADGRRTPIFDIWFGRGARWGWGWGWGWLEPWRLRLLWLTRSAVVTLSSHPQSLCRHVPTSPFMAVTGDLASHHPSCQTCTR